MSYKVDSIPFFDAQLKRLAKKYPSLKTDVGQLINVLEVNPVQGIALGKNCYKIRLAIKSKGKGKSGGARVISYVYVTKNTVYLMSIYDKAEQADISNSDLSLLIKSLE